MAEKTISIELTETELSQLYLCAVARTAFATQKWTCASSAEEQKNLESQIAYLNALTSKLQSQLNANAK